MKWIRRIRGDIEPRARNLGEGCLQEGHVNVRSGTAGKVTAIVNGSGNHLVQIRLDGDAVISYCDCDPFMAGKFCEHIWATLLASEDRGHLGRIASMWDPYLEHGLEYEFDALEPVGDPNAPASTAQVPPQASAPKPPRIPRWKQEIALVRELSGLGQREDGGETRQVRYFVDISECLAAKTLIVQSVVQHLRKNGEWSRPNFQDLWIRNVDQLAPADTRILSLLSPATSFGNAPSQTAISTRHRLPAATFDVLMPMLCATGRFFLRTTDAPDDYKILEWDGGGPYVFRMNIVRDDDPGQYRITACLKRGEENVPLAEPVLLVPGLAFFKNRIAGFDEARAFEWVELLRKDGALKIPVEQRNEFIAELAKFREMPPLEFPDDLRIEPRSFSGPPRVTIRAKKERWNAQGKLECEVSFDYGIEVPEKESAIALKDPARDVFFSRDREAESKVIQRLLDLGMRRVSRWNSQGEWELAPGRLPALVRELVAGGWRVEAEGKLYRRSGNFKLEVTSGVDWFDVRGTAEFEGQIVALPELLKAAKRGDNMVALGDGSYGLLPEEWLSRYRFVGGLGKEDGDQIRFTRGQAGLLDALLASQPEVTFDQGFQKLRLELESFAGVQEADSSPEFKGQLRDYQKEGLGWLRFLRRFGFGGCLADDMGLGKTIQVLALLDSDDRRGPALVVVPRSLVFNWKQEAARFAPRLRVLDLSGAGRKDRWSEVSEHDLVLTTYGTMRRDALQLKDVEFDTIILDEAQAIKNGSSESAKAARLLKASHRLVLTGTPIENHLGDLWSLFEFLNPGLLGSAEVFRMQTSGAPSAETARVLSQALRPFILRRTKDQVARELPPKHEQTIYCELKSEQRKLYNELRDHYRGALLGRIDDLGIQKTRMQILEALLRLRQAACHPGLIDKKRSEDDSAKIAALIPQLQEVVEEGHKALVFSQFTSLLSIVRKRLDQDKIPYLYLDGKTKDRESLVQTFQTDPACSLFLISLKAGGLGLNLTAAEYVFLLDPWWNPAVEAQAIDRAHRIGQSRHVFAYRLIAKDTVEEKVLELQKSKRDLADAIINANNSVLKGLNRETLELLLS
ncbi:MAG TPA: DEAD/DEAH box helicase [Terriglobia bacterium]|jgi:superfamily II DNA or RNA helicase